MNVFRKSPGFPVQFHGIGCMNSVQKAIRKVSFSPPGQIGAVEPGNHRPKATILKFVGLVFEMIRKGNFKFFLVTVYRFYDRMKRW